MIPAHQMLTKLILALLAFQTSMVIAQDTSEITLVGTSPLNIEGDLASQMVDGIDRFLLHQIDVAAASRSERFLVDTSSPEAYEASLKPHREKLAKCLGIRDARLPFEAPEIIVGVGGGAHWS